MSITTWGAPLRAFAAAFAKTAADLAANQARPAPTPPTSADILADLDRLEALLPSARKWFVANPGALTAADDLLDFLEAEGFAWAGALRAGVDAAPELIAEAQAWLPTIRFLFGAAAPAAIGIPGGWAGGRGQISGGR